MNISIYTSGTTGSSKMITHDEADFYKPAKFLCDKWNLTSEDIILNPFPSWTIASWAFCYFPANLSGCQVVNIDMKPLKFWEVVYEIKPTVITLAIGTLRTLLKRKFPNLSYVKNLCTGSAPVTITDIENMKRTGAKNIWNIYGSTECIPPVLISNNEKFDFNDTPYYLTYENSLIVDGFDTEDVFKDNKCLERVFKNKTWKS